MLGRAVANAVASAIGPVLVVTADHVRTTLPTTVATIVNDEWASGQMSSLRRALAWAAAADSAQVVVGLGDQPAIDPSAWQAVAAAGRDAPIAVAIYPGPTGPRRGHPISLDASVWALLPPGGDEGARTVMRLRPDLVREVPCDGSPMDIDTLEDLHRWQKNSSTSSP